MPRTQTSWLQDTGLFDARIPFWCERFLNPAGTAPVFNFSGTEGISLTVDAASSYIIVFDGEVFRSGLQDDLQQQFGSGGVNPSTGLSTPLLGAQGLASPPAQFTTPAGVSGAPPFPGISQLSPVVVPRPKGIEITSITFVFSVAGSAATNNSTGINEYVYAFPPTNGSLSAVPVLKNPSLANGGGLPTAVTPAGQVTSANLAMLNPLYITDPVSQYWLQWFVTPGTTMQLFGVVFNCTFNFN